MEEEDSAVCLDEQMEQTNLCENVIDNYISDEDYVPQTAPEFTNLPVISSPVLPTLVANYESEGNGK